MMKKVSKNVYAETNFQGCNPGFVVTSDGVVMIDTPQMPTDAVKWREKILQYGPVRYLINTEPHGDHFTGNYFFKGTVVAHEGTRQAILAASAQQTKKIKADFTGRLCTYETLQVPPANHYL
jgi:glyoxylase-like metal-dependent hydrolase (beta-lactamase superfamily II)